MQSKLKLLPGFLLLPVLAILFFHGLADAAPKGISNAGTSMEISSPAFVEGTFIPEKYTADGRNISPPLKWSKLPQRALSLALLCEDPDAPKGTWSHWIIYNLPPKQEQLAEGIPTNLSLPDGSQQGKNSFGTIGYSGPDPPPGNPHHYIFKLFALDAKLNLQPGSNKEQFQSAIQGHVLAQAQDMGRYGRHR